MTFDGAAAGSTPDATRTLRTTVDWSAPDPISTSVVRSVAMLAGRPAETLPPLAEVVDPGALDDLFSPGGPGTTRFDGRVEFGYAGYDVTVFASGAVVARERRME